MRKIILCIFVFLCSFSSVAQEFSLKDAVYLNNDETIEVKAGTPIIFTNKASPENVFEPEQVKWRPELPMIETNSFFGQRIQIPFVTHIPSFMIFVQILPNKSAFITERILFVNTERMSYFSRSYPSFLKNYNNNKIPYEINLISASLNGKIEEPRIRNKDIAQEVILFSDSGLSSGVHLIEISYEIPNAVYIDGNVGRLLLDFIGQENPYIVEKGQIIVTYPQNAQLFQAYAFYGKNNQTSPNAGSFYQDQEGHLIYKMNTILPAGINLQLDILSDAITFDVPRPEGLTEKISYYPWFIMILIYCLVIFCYLFFAAQDLKDQFLSKKYMNKVRGRFKYDVTLFRPLILKKSDDLSFFVAVLFLFQKNIIKIDTSSEITFIKENKKTTGLTKKILNFIFPCFIKRVPISLLHWHQKKYILFRKIISSYLHRQLFNFMFREIIICLVLYLFSLILIIFFGVTVIEFIISATVPLVFLLWRIAVFTKKAHLKEQLIMLFKDYADVQQNNDRQFLINIALEKSLDDIDLTQIEKGINMPFNEFEHLFFEQLNMREIKQ